MKFKTPSKPVVRFAYYAGNKLPKNSQNTVGHVLMVPNGGKSFAGNFLRMGENCPVFCASDTHIHGIFPVFCFEDNKKYLMASLCTCPWNKQAHRPVTNQAIRS